MPSFQLSLTPHRRVAARFVANVRRRLQRAYADAPDVNQSDIARELGVHRSVINRQLRGYQDMTLGRVAELSWALGYEPSFDLVPICGSTGNTHRDIPKYLGPERPTFQTRVDTTENEKVIEERQGLETTSA